MRAAVRVLLGLVCSSGATSCSFPRPADVGGVDDGGIDGNGIVHDAPPVGICVASQTLRCESGQLVRCNRQGTAEVSEACPLGCHANEIRCSDVNPSNDLAQYLDMAEGEPILDLGAAASINTDTGVVLVDQNPVAVRTATVPQLAAPSILVLIVRGLSANDVTVSGKNALAILSNGDINIHRLFAASAQLTTPGAGAHNDGACRGGDQPIGTRVLGGTGGGGFGFAGGKGGAATNIDETKAGGTAGAVTGNSTLIPLRGGCDSGTAGARLFGAGGGAVQLVSRAKIAVSGVLAANGSSVSGGGSGGGILLEAPVVEVSGGVFANGGAGAGGCLVPRPGQDGRLDAVRATGGTACDERGGTGGVGGAGSFGTAGGGNNVVLLETAVVFGGHGGGSVGRVRINTISGGLHVTGVLSPEPSTGALATR